METIMRIIVSLSIVAAITSGILLTAPPAHACIDSIVVEDRTTMATYGGCDQSFADYTYGQYDMEDWGDWGSDSACDLNLPFGKVLVASKLFAYGLPNEPTRGRNHDVSWLRGLLHARQRERWRFS